MEKHIEIFCKQNPINDKVVCPKCNAVNKVKMHDFLKIKYKYTLICSKCSAETIIDTKGFHKGLEPLKNFVQ